MKHIYKKEPPRTFIEFILNEHPKKWDDIHHTHKYPNLYHDCLYQIFIEEQCGLGAYTERPLMGARNLHLDHYRKKGMDWHPDVTFDWNNLIAEEQTNNYGAGYKDRHTHEKNDYSKLLNPVIDFPEMFMTYLVNGEIKAKSNLDESTTDRVKLTIDRFNLNHPILKAERARLIKMILSDYHQLADEDIKEALSDNGYPTVVDWALQTRRSLLQ